MITTRASRPAFTRVHSAEKTGTSYLSNDLQSKEGQVSRAKLASQASDQRDANASNKPLISSSSWAPSSFCAAFAWRCMTSRHSTLKTMGDWRAIMEALRKLGKAARDPKLKYTRFGNELRAAALRRTTRTKWPAMKSLFRSQALQAFGLVVAAGAAPWTFELLDALCFALSRLPSFPTLTSLCSAFYSTALPRMLGVTTPATANLEALLEKASAIDQAVPDMKGRLVAWCLAAQGEPAAPLVPSKRRTGGDKGAAGPTAKRNKSDNTEE
jgi:hypothetical protein